MAGVWTHFKCGCCDKVRKTQIVEGVEKITVCGSCGYREIVTREDRIKQYNNYNSRRNYEPCNA